MMEGRVCFILVILVLSLFFGCIGQQTPTQKAPDKVANADAPVIEVPIKNQGCSYSNPECRSDESCLNNTCTKKSGCLYSNSSCALNETCSNNICVLREGCEYANPPCNSNDECLDNTCVKKRGCQYNNPTCSEEELCNQQTGQCEKKPITIDSEIKTRWTNYILAFDDSIHTPTYKASAPVETCYNFLGMTSSNCYSIRTCHDAVVHSVADIGASGIGYTLPDATPFDYYNTTQSMNKQVSFMLNTVSSLTTSPSEDKIKSLKDNLIEIRTSAKNLDKNVLLMPPADGSNSRILYLGLCPNFLFNYNVLDIFEKELNSTIKRHVFDAVLSGCTYGNPRCSGNNSCNLNLNECKDPTKRGCDYSNPPCLNGKICVNNQCVVPTGCQYNNPPCYSDELCVNNQCIFNNPGKESNRFTPGS